jgi:hypothetical protein
MSATNGSRGVTLFIDPFSRHFLQDRLFESESGAYGGEDIQGPWIFLRSWLSDRGVSVFTADRLLTRKQHDEHNVYMSFGMKDNAHVLARRGDVTMSTLFLFEGPIVEPTLYSELADVQDCFKRVYSFSDEESLAPFLRRPVELRHFCLPSPVDDIDEEAWAARDRKFLVMINGNKLPRLYFNELYTERMRAVEFFGRHDEIDLYGIGWDVQPYRMGKTWMPNTLQRTHRALQAAVDRVRPDPLLAAARRRWRGAVEAKTPVLAQYTFALCFENQVLNGWITEKVFDCFRAGTVPVYWGAPDIEQYVPAECFVDMRRFSGYPELREFLHSLSPGEIDGFRTAARDYLRSDAFYPFTKQAFAHRCAELIETDTGVAVPR